MNHRFKFDQKKHHHPSCFPREAALTPIPDQDIIVLPPRGSSHANPVVLPPRGSSHANPGSGYHHRASPARQLSRQSRIRISSCSPREAALTPIPSCSPREAALTPIPDQDIIIVLPPRGSSHANPVVLPPRGSSHEAALTRQLSRQSRIRISSSCSPREAALTPIPDQDIIIVLPPRGSSHANPGSGYHHRAPPARQLSRQSRIRISSSCFPREAALTPIPDQDIIIVLPPRGSSHANPGSGYHHRNMVRTCIHELKKILLSFLSSS